MKKFLLGASLVISIFVGLFAALRSFVSTLDLVGTLWSGRPMVSPPIPISADPLPYMVSAIFWAGAAWLLLRTIPKATWAQLCRMA